MDNQTLDFIRKHKLNELDFFDAKGRTAADCRSEMKSKNKIFVYNTTPCSKGGHKIRDRSGHCIVCKPAGIAFNRRHTTTATIYLLGSIKMKLIKIGMTTESIETRVSKLNSRKVGNTNDWVALRTFESNNAGDWETRIHHRLNKYLAQGNYYDRVESREMYRCSFSKSNEVINNLILELKWEITNNRIYHFKNEDYKFPDL